MLKLDLIEFSDYVRPGDIVDEIIKQNPNLKAPIAVEQVAEATGITDILYQPLDGLEGALVANEYKSEGVILVNNKPRENGLCRQRYTVGHELGHFMIPSHGYEMSCSVEDMKNNVANSPIAKIELQANDFSSKLLMPKRLFCNHRAFDKRPSIANVKTLALEFDVSFEACMNRYVLLHHEPIAVIFYKDNKFRYFRNSSYMPFYFFEKPKKGVPVPFGSLSSRLASDQFEKIHNDLVDSSVWLSEAKGFALPEELIEEVYIQNNGYSVTMLTFEDELEEVE